LEGAKPSEAKASLGHPLAGFFLRIFHAAVWVVRCIWKATGVLEDTAMDEVAPAYSDLFTFLMTHPRHSGIFTP
jgi:hypothetical protein